MQRRRSLRLSFAAQPSRLSALVLALAMGTGAIVYMRQTHASTVVATTEAEAGTVAGNAVAASDTSASGGSAVRFGNQQPTTWLTRLSGVNYTAMGITWRSHLQGPTSSTLQVQQDANVENHFLMTVGEAGVPSDTSTTFSALSWSRPPATLSTVTLLTGWDIRSS